MYTGTIKISEGSLIKNNLLVDELGNYIVDYEDNNIGTFSIDLHNVKLEISIN